MSMIGKTLGHYSVSALLGKGGMGEVYKAKDQKLGRDVAIKVLPEEFARDADRVARFQREAKLLASLNHPNIAAIHGLEESDGTHFLVLELIEGDTLADRIRGGPIPVEESLKFALQIAEALEAAHEKGVIHRDLKPANIKITPDGKVKVLDFGLAKAYVGNSEDMNLSNSPTLSVAATQQGIILGTAAYMSPEQARGKSVDKRTDIWAFGVVLFEMLAGRPVFAGEDVSQTLARVLERQPDFSMLPPNLQPRIIEMLERCLEKETNDRYSGISDARVDIKRALAEPTGVYAQPLIADKPQSKLQAGFRGIAGALVLGAIIAVIATWIFRPTPPRPRIVRFSVDLADELSYWGGELDSAITLSPDGSRFVYAANNQLYVQALDQMEPTPIPGTEGGSQPFFSPDGESVAFFTNTQLKTVSLTGVAPVVLAEVGENDGPGLIGAWDAKGRIFFGRGGSFGLFQVPAGGGTPELFAELGDQVDFDFPDVLPGGEWVLFTDLATSGSWSQNASIVAQSIETGERKLVLKGGCFARYVPTGHLVYVQNGTLFAVAFDADKVEVTGKAVPIVQGVASSDTGGFAGFAVADNGTLIYIPDTMGRVTGDQRTLVWLDREGNEEPLEALPNEYTHPVISPDGTRVAVSINTGGNEDIWIWDLLRKIPTRLTFDEASDAYPLWTRDGKQIVFSSNRGGTVGVFWKSADGTGKAEQLGSLSGTRIIPSSWSSDGNDLVLEETSAESRNTDVSIISMEGDHTRKALLKGEFTEANPQVSPDGRWLAYISNESGQAEIFVRPFPDVNGGKWQISSSGGLEPKWSPDGKELFYRDPNRNAMMIVDVETESTFRAGSPKEFFRGAYFSSIGHNWDISPDGKKFLMIKLPGSPDAASAEESSTDRPRPRINVVLNWFEELKERVPIN